MAEKGRVNIISSNLNFAPVHAVTWSAARMRSALGRAGYKGLSYVPIYSRLAWQINRGKDTKDLVVGTEQTFREDTGLAVIRKAARRLPNVLAAGFQLAMDVDMVAMDDSDRVAAYVQRRVGIKGPHVVHPNGQLLGDRLHPAAKPPTNPPRDYRALAEAGFFSELQWQPTAEWAAARRVLSRSAVTTAQNMVEAAHDEGLGKAAFDANHAAAERHGFRFDTEPGRVDRAAEIAGYLAANGQLGVFEFSLQSNLGGDSRDLRAIMDGRLDETPQGIMFAEAATNVPPGEDFTIKVQIAAREFAAIGMDYQRGHEALAPYLRNYAVSYLSEPS